MCAASQLSRYAAVATLLLKHRPDLLAATAAGTPPQRSRRRRTGRSRTPREGSRKARSDVHQARTAAVHPRRPAAAGYLEALSRLQDDVEPVPLADIQKTIEDELGVRLSKAFSSFDPRAARVGVAGTGPSRGLRDGRPVAVKVQRPGHRRAGEGRPDALDEIAAFVDHAHESRPPLRVRADDRRVPQGADGRARLQRRGRAICGRSGDNLAEFERIIVPLPGRGLRQHAACSRWITCAGTKVTALNPVALIDVDPEGLAEELIRAYLHQILIDGFFHADPHPGNVFITDDGRIALIDLGMVGHLSPTLQDKLLKLVLAISEGRGEEAADAAIALGEMREGFDEAASSATSSASSATITAPRSRIFRSARSCSKSTAPPARTASSRRSS